MPEHPSGVSGAFRLPFAEQIIFFRRKLSNLVPTRRWDDMLGTAHDHGFMVAGAMEADLLTDLGAAVDKAITEGRGIADFRKDFRSVVQRRGWTGWTGEGSVKGEAWRVKVIYQTNSYTSYAAGRYAQLTAENYPFWIYRHGGSLEPRPMHVDWDGMALPPAHLFWIIYYPPSDWGCSCYVVGARSAAGVRRLGGDPDRVLPDDWNRIDPGTGGPVGVGKGWGYAPGASVANVVTALTPKLEKYPNQLAVALLQEWVRSETFKRWTLDPHGTFPLVRLPAADAEAIGSKQATALLSPETMAKQVRNHPELTWQDYRLAQSVIDAPTIRVQDSPNTMTYVRIAEEDSEAGGHVLVVKTTRSGEGLFITSFRRVSRDQARRDRTLRGLLARQDRLDENGRR